MPLKFFAIAMIWLLSVSVTQAQAVNSGDIGQPPQELGTFIDLPSGQSLQIMVEDQKITARFIGADGLVVVPLADFIQFEITQPGHPHNGWRAVLSLSEGSASLSSPRMLSGPYRLRARLIINFTEATPFALHNVSLQLDRQGDSS